MARDIKPICLALVAMAFAFAAWPDFKEGFLASGPREGWVRTKGRVINTGLRFRGQHLPPATVATITFQVGDRNVTFRDEVETSTGSELTLVYDPDDPRRAEVGDGRTHFRLSAIFLLGMAFASGIAARKLWSISTPSNRISAGLS